MFSKVAAPFPGRDPAGGKSHRDRGRVRRLTSTLLSVFEKPAATI